MKMTAIDKQWKNVKITGKLDVFPNESQVKVFYDMETLEISWTDPDDMKIFWTHPDDMIYWTKDIGNTNIQCIIVSNTNHHR